MGKNQKQLDRIEEKLDFMIGGLSRTVAKKGALGNIVQERISGEQLFAMWKNKKKAEEPKKIPNEKS